MNTGGDISYYYPDFMVKLSDKRIVIVETKGQGDLDVPLKMARLRQWCEDISRVQTDVVYVRELIAAAPWGHYESPHTILDPGIHGFQRIAGGSR